MPHASPAELNALIEELVTGNPPAPARLALLSDLPRDQVETVRRSWERIPRLAREALLDEATILAEGDVALDFSGLAEIGLADPDASVRISAIAALWECRDRGVAQKLVKTLEQDPEESVRAAAAGALREFVFAFELDEMDGETGETVVSALRTAFSDRTEAINVRAAAIEALGARSEEWVDTLITEAFYDEERVLRVAALRAMGDSANERWLDLLQEDVESEDADLRLEAALAVGEIGDEQGLELLMPLLEDDYRHVVIAAIRAIGAIGGESAIEVLEEFREDLDDQELAEEVAAAIDIARFGEEGDPDEWDE